MPSRGLSVLAIITVTVVVACWLVTVERYSTVDREAQQGGLVFPALQYQLAKIADIEVARAGGEFVLSRRENTWANMGMDGFPAIATRVESVIIAMAGMKYVAPKTKLSKLYFRLQVEDVTPTAKSTRLTFKDDAGGVLADVIIGKPKDQPNQQNVYMRLAGDEQTWLAEGIFDVHHDAADWSDRTVVDFDARSLNELTVSKSGGETVALYRNQPQDEKMTLKNLPAGATIEHQYQIDYMTGLLQELNFIDAMRAEETTSKARPAFEVVARWKNHVEVTFRTDEPMPDGSVWAQIDARVTNHSQASNSEKQEVARIRSNFSGWNIKLPRKFTERMKIRLNDIVKPGVAS